GVLPGDPAVVGAFRARTRCSHCLLVPVFRGYRSDGSGCAKSGQARPMLSPRTKVHSLACWQLGYGRASVARETDAMSALPLFPATIAGSLPKPSWLAEPEKLWAPWKLEGEELVAAKR